MKEFFKNPYVIGVIVALLNVVFRKYLEPALPNLKELKTLRGKILRFLRIIVIKITGYVIPVLMIYNFSFHLFDTDANVLLLVFTWFLTVIMLTVIIYNLIMDFKGKEDERLIM